MTFGSKLNLMRKKAGLTQEEIAGELGISPQAVSKWENDLSCPDIMLLPRIAQIYNISVDELLNQDYSEVSSVTVNSEIFEKKSDAQEHQDNEIPKQPEKLFADKAGSDKRKMFLKVNVVSRQGDIVNVKLPLSLLKAVKGLLGSIKLNKSMTGGIDLSEIDFDMIFELVEQGAVGEIVNVVSQNGDVIDVFAECE